MSDMEKQPLIEESPSTPEAEPSLAELKQNFVMAHQAYVRAWQRSTGGRIQRRIMLVFTTLFLAFVLFCVFAIIDDELSGNDTDWSAPHRTPHRIPLEAHIMSKCPDAKDCLHDLVLPAMQNVSDKADFRLSYIGSKVGSDGVECMHGQQECLGNMIEQCAAHLYPDPKIYLGFVMCLTRDYQDIPSRDLVEDCALEHNMLVGELNQCLKDEDGGEAIDRLRASFDRTKEAGVTKSCTVRVDEEIWCVRDGGEWKDCPDGFAPEDLVMKINDLYASQWSSDGTLGST